jgi:hypothetical protein
MTNEEALFYINEKLLPSLMTAELETEEGFTFFKLKHQSGVQVGQLPVYASTLDSTDDIDKALLSALKAAAKESVFK